jgi:hypothetical protein
MLAMRPSALPAVGGTVLQLLNERKTIMNGKTLAGERRGQAAQRRNVNFALTLSQFEELQDMAMMADMQISEYIRYAIFGAAAARRPRNQRSAPQQ